MQNTRLLIILLVVLGTAAPLLPAESVVHVVERGQTIYSIARRYGVPQALIIAANDITDPRSVPVGTLLSIPGTYEVKRGDSYYSIARRYGIGLDELLSANNRSADSVLREGEVLTLPESARAMASEEEVRENAEAVSDISDGRDMVLERSPEVVETNVPTPNWPIVGMRLPMSGKLPGVTINGSVGDEVRSVASGRVRYTGPYSAFGRVVIVQSPEGYVYVYGGTENVIVNVGELVFPGSLLGVLGSGAHSDDPTLYFSVWKGNVPVDPEDAPRG